jgi:hypothetical protein
VISGIHVVKFEPKPGALVQVRIKATNIGDATFGDLSWGEYDTKNAAKWSMAGFSGCSIAPYYQKDGKCFGLIQPGEEKICEHEVILMYIDDDAKIGDLVTLDIDFKDFGLSSGSLVVQ